jgi:hypothetical protein
MSITVSVPTTSQVARSNGGAARLESNPQKINTILMHFELHYRDTISSF